jgi:DNA-binding response OmpR family regulator
VKLAPWALLADDSDDDASLALRVLARVAPNLQVQRARDGEEALGMLASHQDAAPAIALVDLKMPRVDGFCVLERVRPAPYPVLVLTSSDVEADRARASALGCAEFVTKPIDYGDYVAVVSAAVRRHLPALG